MEAQHKLIHQSALAVIISADNQSIQLLRKQYDPAYERWPPHINICYPFVEAEQCPQMHKKLQQLFEKLPQFEIKFKQMRYFKNGTIYLHPQTASQELLFIHKQIINKFPFLAEKRQFTPHMTIGKFKKGELNGKTEELNKNWIEKIIKCTGIEIIQREKQTPFKTTHIINFI